MIAIPQPLEIGSILPLRTGLHVELCRITDIAQIDGVLLYLVRSGALEFWLNERALQARRGVSARSGQRRSPRAGQGGNDDAELTTSSPLGSIPRARRS
jgi:hypothetical protein